MGEPHKTTTQKFHFSHPSRLVFLFFPAHSSIGRIMIFPQFVPIFKLVKMTENHFFFELASSKTKIFRVPSDPQSQ